MYYEVWIDADGKRHIIDEMETKYIENCIESIKKQCWPTLIESGEFDERPKQDYQVLSAEWCEHCANGYLKMFYKVLNERKKNM